jgi:hypothetical protein
VDEMPPELRKLIEAENDRHKKKQEEKEREREMVALKIYYQNLEQEIKVHNRCAHNSLRSLVPL